MVPVLRASSERQLRAHSKPEMEEWRILREGIQIKSLAKDPERGIQIDIIKLAPSLDDPPHWHNGFEWVYILEGSMEDDKGLHKKGDFLSNYKDQKHKVRTEEGCTALIVWTGSVRNKP